ncbi:MAG: M48 family metalloprotease [Myxococcales bacterium]|nr:M48 family metalloprotease [Myxococcales bacterium]
MDLADAKDVLRRFLVPGADAASLLRALRPERRDYAEVFVQAAVEAAVATYEPAWNGGALGVRTTGAVDVELWGATTDELRSGDAPAGKSFAPEWRGAARYLRRGLTFHGFRFVDAAGHAVGGGSPEVDVRLTARLFSWLRYAELSADRVGLACAGSFEAAASALLKMTTGLHTERWVKGGAELARQYAELATLGTEQSPQLWFETHPFSPLRLKSLELFARSAPLAEFLGHMGAQVSAAELEREVRQIMAWMDPVLPRASAPEALRRFASFAGALVMLSDGTTDPEEGALLARIGTAELLGEVAEALRSGADALRRALAAAAAAALLLAPRTELVKLIEEVASMAMVTGGASEPERQVLHHAAELLRLEPGVVDAALARLGRGLD